MIEKCFACGYEFHENNELAYWERDIENNTKKFIKLDFVHNVTDGEWNQTIAACPACGTLKVIK